MKLLYLCHRIPFPPDKGDKIRSFHQVRYLAERHELDLFTLIDDTADEVHVEALRGLVRRAHFERIHPLRARISSLRGLGRGRALSVLSFEHAGLRRAVVEALSSGGYDAAIVYSSNMAPYLGASTIPRVLDFVDVDSAKWLAYAEQLGSSPLRWLYRREGRLLRQLERELSESAEVTVVCSRREEEELRSFASPRRLVAVNNGTDVDYFHPAPAEFERPSDAGEVVFTGAMDYRANADAIVWFVEHVLPRIRESAPATRLAVVGSNPAPAVRRLESVAGVTVTGRVEDVRPYLWSARVSVAPLRVARGVQNKVLEALSCGVPVACTPQALGGIENARGVVERADPAELAATILSLLDDRDAAMELGRAGRAFVESEFRWERQLAQLERLVLDAASENGTAEPRESRLRAAE